ncbi:LysM peptidoglycan-binding domain-containing protein [Microtetraspora malaysiensis]|uniref:LysM peptidoglycan-binding domain-containing protein n=1 Tax=Microtetraspora malaysiensis TaxID=161358 RepID=UPI003D9307F3
MVARLGLAAPAQGSGTPAGRGRPPGGGRPPGQRAPLPPAFPPSRDPAPPDGRSTRPYGGESERSTQERPRSSMPYGDGPDRPGRSSTREGDRPAFGAPQHSGRHPNRQPGRRSALRRPVRIPPRRTARDILAGITALLALVALVGGVPYALIRLAGPPLRPELRDLDLLTSDVGPETVTAILVLLVWLAWLQLFVCVIVEVYAGIRRVGMPARVPLSGGTQALANRLVSAVLLLFAAAAVAGPVIGPVTGGGQPPAIRPQAATLSAPVVTAEDRPPLQAREVKKVYVVQPPHGRHHESLWEIAEKCLGEGRRYPEIFRLNQHKQQPDGSRLRMADLIRPGWVLDMPDDARNVLIVPIDEDRPVTLDHHPRMPSDTHGDLSDDLGHDMKGGAEGKDEVRLPPPALPERHGEETAGHPPSRSSDGSPHPSQERRTDGEPSLSGHHAQEDDAGLDLADYLAAASLVAAGLLALLGRRRREQLWRRAFGRRVVPPRGDAARAEVAIRLGADAPGSRMLDLGLRLLGRLLAEQDRRPPTIYAVHLSSRGLDLWIHPADLDAPAPWEACDGGQVWRLPAQEGRLIDEGRSPGRPLRTRGSSRWAPPTAAGSSWTWRPRRASSRWRVRRPWPPCPRSPSSWPPTAGRITCGSPSSASARSSP